jgi:two-component system sensor histidine kinase GlrK
LEDITKSILRFDNRLIDLEQKLSDGLLSMMRYEKKYIINKDEELYDLFSLAKGGFDKHFEEIMSVADSARTRDLLGRVNLNYQNYQSSFDEEVRYLKSGEDYPRDSYEKERGQAVNSIMKDLRKLRMHSQINTSDKIKQLGAAEGEAIRLAIGMTIISFIFIVAISIVITINITKPLSVMKKKTREIAKGEFGGDLKLSSSPEIKELAHALNSMCAKLKEIDKMKSDFFSLMSHELRTPLTSIREGTNLLMESFKAEEITKDQKKLLVIMTEESNRLIKLVNSLLDLSKMEAGMMVYNFTRADLIPLINRVTREIEPLAETKNIKIEVQAGKELPLIKIDGEGMLKVLRNLIGNAVKFTPDSGYVRVLAQTIEQGVKVSVEDTGSGISKESLTSIFDKFQQGILTHSNKIKGTGLGLFIAKQIINAHGGRIWAESTVGQGSTFAFVLPA